MYAPHTWFGLYSGVHKVDKPFLSDSKNLVNHMKMYKNLTELALPLAHTHTHKLEMALTLF